MSVLHLLSRLRLKDIKVWAEGGRLRFDAPEGAMTPDLREELVEHKAEILALLRKADIGTGATTPPLDPIPRDGALALSFAQERLWFLARLFQESPAYNVPFITALAGVLDVAALRKALQSLVDRHESLRTFFPETDGKPVQVIHDLCPLTLSEHDLRELPEAERESAADELIEVEILRPFDLEHGPVIRAALLRMADHEHILLITAHHIATDGWSLGIMQRDLAALYNAYVRQQPPSLPPLPVQYADFAHWQRQWLAGEVLDEQIRYWRMHLEGLSNLDLPTDRPRPPAQTHTGASHSFQLPTSLTAALEALSREAGVTLATTLLAAFQALLARYSGQTDIAVGSPIANRTRSDIENLIGFFVNTLVMRTDMSGDPSFLEALIRANDAALGAYEHQDLPFEQLVGELQPTRDFSRNPLFQVMFAFQNVPDEAAAFEGLTIRPVGKEVTTTRVDLQCSVREGEEGLTVTLVFDTALFERETIERLGGHFRNVLNEVVSDPRQRLSQIDILDDVERQRLLVEWSGPRQEHPAEKVIHERFEAQVARAPEATAVVFEEEHLTYAQLNRRANRLAHLLRKQGVGPGVLVGLCIDRSLEMVVGILGILKAGGAYVPLDTAHPQDRLNFILQDAHVSVLVTQERLAERFVEQDRPVICLDAAGDLLARESTKNPGWHGGVDSAAYVIYTSGSTGKPKGVLVTHANVGRLFDATQSWYDFDASDVWTLFHSYAFDFSVWELWGALFHGGKVVMVPYWVSREPEAFYELLAREQVTVLNQTPSAFRQLIRADETADTGEELALRLVIFGGEALDLQSLRPWFERHGDQRPQLVNMYGITETTVHVTYRPLRSADLSQASGSVIGCPIPDLQVYVLDEYLQPVPIGVPGELHVGGAGLGTGYLNRPGLTAERFLPDPFSPDPGARLYKTGDLVRFRSNGDLEYLGRIDHQVKIRGFRIELGEIQAVLGELPEIREAVVIVREDSPENKRIVAYLVPSDGPLSPHDLRQTLKQRLPDYMVPAHFVMLDALPVTPNGKVSRTLCQLPSLRLPSG